MPKFRIPRTLPPLSIWCLIKHSECCIPHLTQLYSCYVVDCIFHSLTFMWNGISSLPTGRQNNFFLTIFYGYLHSDINCHYHPLQRAHKVNVQACDIRGSHNGVDELWVVCEETPCSLVNSHQLFRSSRCVRLQDSPMIFNCSYTNLCPRFRPVANTDPKGSSRGMVYNAVFPRTTIPHLRIRIRHWSRCII